MSEQPVFYTRGDIAKAKLVTATTVANWDIRGLLTPSATTMSGIKLYTQADVEKLDKLRRG